MAVPDTVEARVEVVYSNIGAEWHAMLVDDDGKEIIAVRASTRAGVLRELADEIDGEPIYKLRRT